MASIHPSIVTLNAVIYTIYAAINIFLSIWTVHLVNKFKSQSHHANRSYAIVILIFVILCTICYSIQALTLWLCTLSKNVKLDSQRVDITTTRFILIGAFILGLLATDIAFLPRIILWLRAVYSPANFTHSTFCVLYTAMAIARIVSLGVLLGEASLGYLGLHRGLAIVKAWVGEEGSNSSESTAAKLEV